MEKFDDETYIVVENNHAKSHTMLPVHTLLDKNLSLNALGILLRCVTYLEQFPDRQDFCMKHFVSLCKEGSKSVTKYINELVEKGYALKIYYNTVRPDGSIFEWKGMVQYYFSETKFTKKRIRQTVKFFEQENEDKVIVEIKSI